VLNLLDTQITAVTVYTDRALITRRGVINLTGVETTLAIAHLPTTLDLQSVRVSGKGSVAVKLEGVTIERQYTTEPVVDRIAHLTTEIERLETNQRRFQAQLDSITLQSNFVEGLRQKTEESFSRGLARQQIGLEDTLNLLNFIGTKHTEYAYAIEDIRSQLRVIDRDIAALRSQRERIQYPQSQENFQINVAIEPGGAGEFQLELNYVVSRASWIPLYDLRVHSIHSNITLSYLAEITQTTGEDWSNVNLILSTAKPGLGTLPPKLNPWYIDVPTQPPVLTRLRAIAMSEKTSLESPPTQVSAGVDEMADLDLAPMEYEVETVVAELSQQGSIVTFNLGGGGNIPSDGNPHTATILYDNFPCQFTYLAMPRLVSFAYLQAKAKNRTDGAILLAGKANIFRDEMGSPALMVISFAYLNN
jgi:uncharacterized protein (TIGR02231 family)